MTLTGGDSPGDGAAVKSDFGDLTLTDLSISGNITRDRGGGISVFSANVVIYNSEISDNAGQNQGGAVAFRPFLGEYSATITDSLISGNTATGGGGIYARSGHLTILRSTITDNTSRLGGRGGGIWKLSGNSLSPHSLTIQDSTISSNTHDFGSGGGIAINGQYPASHTILIENSQIIGNQARRDSTSNPEVLGGGIFIEGGDLTVRGSVISNNVADNPATGSVAARGGGIAARNANQMIVSVTVSKSTISGNTADLGGGIAVNRSTTGQYYSPLTVAYSTLSGNSASYAGAVYSYSSTSHVSTILSNSTVSGNSGISAVGNLNRALIEYSTITDNQTGVYAFGLSGFYSPRLLPEIPLQMSPVRCFNPMDTT